MADPLDWSILDAVRGCLAGINGAGGYAYDLSGTDQVQITDMPLVSEVLPFASVTLRGVGRRPGEALSTLMDTLAVDIGVLATYTQETPSSRQRAVLALLYDVRRALEADRCLTVSGTCLALDTVITREDFLMGDSPEWDASYIGVSLTVEVTRQRVPGAA